MLEIDSNWHEKQTLYFLHVHKTAGSTFTYWLRQMYDSSKVFPGNWPKINQFPQENEEFKKFILNMSESRLIHGHFQYDAVINNLPAIPLRLIMLRDSVERYISAYYHLQRPDTEFANQNHGKIRGMCIDEFIEHPQFGLYQANICTRLLSGVHPMDINGQMDLKLAKERLEQFEYIGLTEQYGKSLDLFCGIFNLPMTRYVHSRNIGYNKSGEIFSNAGRIKKIEALNAADIELYYFGIQLFEKRLKSLNQFNVSMPMDVPKDMWNQDFSFVYPGQGWYMAEQKDDRSINRWSGPERVSYLYIPCMKSGQYILRLDIAWVKDPGLISGIRFFWDGTEFPVIKKIRSGNKWLIFARLEIGERSTGGIKNEFSIALPELEKPSDLVPFPKEQRVLGISCRNLSIKPIKKLLICLKKTEKSYRVRNLLKKH